MSVSDGAGVLRIPEMYKTNALASSWGCPKTKLRREDEQRDIPKRVNQEACLAVPENLPECLSVILPGDSSGECFEDLRLHVPPVSYDQLFRLFFRVLLPSGVFHPSVINSFYHPFSLHHMYFGSQSSGDVVILKFDMHVYPSVMTFDEVKNLVAEYTIPLDLHPCVPPSGLTMNKLLVDKIGLNRLTMFEIYCRSLEINPSVNLFCAFYKQDSSVANPPPTGVHAKDIRLLCENIIDLRPVHPVMLNAVGLTTIWTHVGHHPIFKDGEGTGNLLPACLSSLNSRWPEVFLLARGQLLRLMRLFCIILLLPCLLGLRSPRMSGHSYFRRYHSFTPVCEAEGCFAVALLQGGICIAFEWIINELGSVIHDYYSREPKMAHNVILHELLYVISSDSSQRLCFDPFRKVVDGYDDEF
ncbi:hypothetical protein Tco_1522741 [Tanacetum coccineum]